MVGEIKPSAGEEAVGDLQRANLVESRHVHLAVRLNLEERTRKAQPRSGCGSHQNLTFGWRASGLGESADLSRSHLDLPDLAE